MLRLVQNFQFRWGCVGVCSEWNSLSPDCVMIKLESMEQGKYGTISFKQTMFILLLYEIKSNTLSEEIDDKIRRKVIKLPWEGKFSFFT